MALRSQAATTGTQFSALARIEAGLSQLSPSEHRIGSSILKDPGQIIVRSVGELAEEFGVAQPTLSRFAKSLGFSGFPALRLAVAHDIAATTPGEDETTGFARGFSQYSQALRGSDTVAAVARLIAEAPAVEIWTSPDFRSVGDYLAAQLQTLGIASAADSVVSNWTLRAAGDPAGTLCLLLSSRTDDPLWDAGIVAARRHDMKLAAVAVAPVRKASELVDELIVLPHSDPQELSGFLFAETLRDEVRAATGAERRPARSSRRRWRHETDFMLNGSAEPLPTTFLHHADSEDRPLVIFYSGMSAHRSQGVPPGESVNRVSPAMVAALLDTGYNVLLPDSPAHGDRKRAWETTSDLILTSLNGHGDDLIRLGVTEATPLIDSILANELVSGPGKIAVVGHSWGGFQTLCKTIGDARIATSIAVMPIIDPRQLPEFAKTSPSIDLAAESINRLRSRPLLLIAGGKDDIADERHVRDFYDAVRPTYFDEPERLSYHVLPEVGHEYHRDQLELMLEWLGRYLPVVHPDRGGE